VGGVHETIAGWSGAARRMAAVPHAPLLATALLATAGAAEALARALSVPSGAPAPAASQVIALVLIGLSTTLPAGLAWTQPTAAALTACAGAVLSIALFRTLTVAGLVTVLAVLYRLGRAGPSQLLAVALAVPFLVLALAETAGGETRVLTILAAWMAPAAAWAGIAHQARVKAAQDSAARQVIAGTLLENSARWERARIARELHDVVAHHVSMIAVQAETARLTTPGMPEAGARRLSSIGDTARTALTEMRRLLGVLREDTGDPVADRRPQPGLAQLNELIDRSREASGTGTRLIVSGHARALDPAVELAAYRIVQEALTNARRHARGAAVDVELGYAGDLLRLRIRDNGPGPPDQPSEGGLGLAGMRDRAAAVGGALRTSRAAGGGFLVTAALPAAESAIVDTVPVEAVPAETDPAETDPAEAAAAGHATAGHATAGHATAGHATAGHATAEAST